MTEGILLKDADPWRAEAWDMIRQRPSQVFFFITKRIERFAGCVPSDWGAGWPHVHIAVTVENQAMADRRLPVLEQAPIAHKYIVCEPLPGPVDLWPRLGPRIRSVSAGGESGEDARLCDYSWILSLREQCQEAGISFGQALPPGRIFFGGQKKVRQRKSFAEILRKTGNKMAA